MRALGQASGALEALAALLPHEAERVTDGGTELVPIDELRPGDVVLVRPGGRVPADGIVVEGEAELDESMITGESRPVGKRPGDRVVAGTVAADSAIRVKMVQNLAWANWQQSTSWISPSPFSLAPSSCRIPAGLGGTR
jgi:Cu2+-exporting ATPase